MLGPMVLGTEWLRTFLIVTNVLASRNVLRRGVRARSGINLLPAVSAVSAAWVHRVDLSRKGALILSHAQDWRPACVQRATAGLGCFEAWPLPVNAPVCRMRAAVCAEEDIHSRIA